MNDIIVLLSVLVTTNLHYIFPQVHLRNLIQHLIICLQFKQFNSIQLVLHSPYFQQRFLYFLLVIVELLLHHYYCLLKDKIFLLFLHKVIFKDLIEKWHFLRILSYNRIYFISIFVIQLLKLFFKYFFLLFDFLQLVFHILNAILKSIQTNTRMKS